MISLSIYHLKKVLTILGNRCFPVSPSLNKVVKKMRKKTYTHTVGKGFILTPPPFTPPYKHPNATSTACISVFHQLHCLAQIRSAYYAPFSLSNVANHVDHCFDYLRMALMCAGDTSLEWVLEGEVGTDGSGAVHMCRDYGALRTWAEERRSDDSSGTL